jgi:hypothetical protein
MQKTCPRGISARLQMAAFQSDFFEKFHKID